MAFGSYFEIFENTFFFVFLKHTTLLIYKIFTVSDESKVFYSSVVSKKLIDTSYNNTVKCDYNLRPNAFQNSGPRARQRVTTAPTNPEMLMWHLHGNITKSQLSRFESHW